MNIEDSLISRNLEDELPTYRITNDPRQTSLEEYLNVSLDALRTKCDEAYIQFSHRLRIYLYYLKIHTKAQCMRLDKLLCFHYNEFKRLRATYHKNPTLENKTRVFSKRTMLVEMQDELYQKSEFLKMLHRGGHDKVAEKHRRNMIRLYSEFSLHANTKNCSTPVKDRIILARGVLRKILLELKSFMLSAFPVWNRNRNVIHRSFDGEINHITDSRDYINLELKKSGVQNTVYVCRNCQRVSDTKEHSSRLERCPYCSIQTGLYDNIVDQDLLMHFTRNEMNSIDARNIFKSRHASLGGDELKCSRRGKGRKAGIWRRRGNSYKRLNHFKDCIKQVQGCTVEKVKSITLDRVKRAMQFREIHESRLNPSMCRSILENIKDHHNYENNVSICCILNPTFRPMRFTGEQQAQLCLRFLMLESVFDQAKVVASSNRKNFLSYHFMLRRLCSMDKDIDRDKMIESVRNLKSTRLLAIHEKIWREMCRLLGWTSCESQA